MNETPPGSQNRHFRVTMLVDELHLFERSLMVVDQEEALLRAVRWVVTQLGTFRVGQKVQIQILKVETPKKQQDLMLFKTRPMGPSDSLEITDRIRVPRGTRYRTTRPGAPGIVVAKRSYFTIVGRKTEAEDDDVSWAGNGGYTCWADKSKIEKVIE